MITNKLIQTQVMTCGACPEQYEGGLVDGRAFYFRFRHGTASLGIGYTRRGAIIDPDTVYLEVIQESTADGIFDSDQIRNETFARLIAQRLQP